MKATAIHTDSDMHKSHAVLNSDSAQQGLEKAEFMESSQLGQERPLFRI